MCPPLDVTLNHHDAPGQVHKALCAILKIKISENQELP